MASQIYKGLTSFCLVTVKGDSISCSYMVYSGALPPGEADLQTLQSSHNLGDLYIQGEGDTVWIYGTGGWFVADTSEDSKGNAVERFPADSSSKRGRIAGIFLRDKKWISRREASRISESNGYLLPLGH